MSHLRSMVFQSTDYLIFLIAVLAGYWMAPRTVQRFLVLGFAGLLLWWGQPWAALAAVVAAVAEIRWPMAGRRSLLLLVTSYFFYCYVHPWYALLLGLTTVIDWYCALGIVRNPNKRRRFLVVSLATNFSILAIFKYCGFFVNNVVALADSLGFNLQHPHWKIMLPVGISFYTFQSASYVVDVFRGQTTARRNLFDYALFVSFFPQHVAGPIERAGHLLSQLELDRRFDPLLMRSGIGLILWGLFLKKVIADNTATIVNKVFALEQNSFPILWAGVLAYGVQIYADFSAYTNIARGSAKLLGIDVCQNFNHPYLASNPADFWRRWHISLSTWFRDYVYIPLGGNRGSTPRVVRNILLTFGLSGLWHGANWNFIFWGLFHGLLVAGWHLLDSHCPKLAKGGGWGGNLVRTVLTFVAVHIAWLMFREQNLTQLWHALTLNPFIVPLKTWETGLFLAVQTLVYALPLWILPLSEKILGQDWQKLPPEHSWKRVAFDSGLAALLVIGILALSSQVGSDFIYFQF